MKPSDGVDCKVIEPTIVIPSTGPSAPELQLTVWDAVLPSAVPLLPVRPLFSSGEPLVIWLLSVLWSVLLPSVPLLSALLPGGALVDSMSASEPLAVGVGAAVGVGVVLLPTAAAGTATKAP
jgi:hypothetical protein